MAKLVVEGLDELITRFHRHPEKFKAAMGKTMQAVLLKIWELVPAYPEENPDSTYVRTGTLGRSLGSSESGGKAGGEPDIYEMKQGAKFMEASFGTRLGYAVYTIGEQQSKIHQNRWWTLHKTVVERALRSIENLFRAFAEELSAWLDHGK